LYGPTSLPVVLRPFVNRVCAFRFFPAIIFWKRSCAYTWNSKFGCKGLCQQGIDKIRFLVFGFRETLTLFARRQSLRDNNRPIQAFVIISLSATTIHQLKPSSAPVSPRHQIKPAKMSVFPQQQSTNSRSQSQEPQELQNTWKIMLTTKRSKRSF
jgi:hypothetical protein